DLYRHGLDVEVSHRAHIVLLLAEGYSWPTIGAPLEAGVRRLLPVEHHGDGVRPRVGLPLEDLVEDLEAHGGSRRRAAGEQAGVPRRFYPPKPVAYLFCHSVHRSRSPRPDGGRAGDAGLSSFPGLRHRVGAAIAVRPWRGSRRVGHIPLL